MGKKPKQGKKNGDKKGNSENGSKIQNSYLAGRKNKQAKKSKGKNNVVDDDDLQFRRSLEADGRYSINEMDADGNCLFRSLSDQLFLDNGSRHADIRSAVCDFIEQHEDEFSGFLVLDENEEDEDAKDFETYVANMRKDAEWGGNLELVAAARLFRRNIMVFSAPLSAFTISHGGGESSGDNLHLSYHDNLHYSSVLDEQSFQTPSSAKKILEVIPETLDKEHATKLKTLSVENEQGKNFDERQELAGAEHKVQPALPLNNSKLKKGDPCPCGSGQKYKKCCLAKEKHSARLRKLKDKNGREDEVCGGDETGPNFEMNGKFRVLQI